MPNPPSKPQAEKKRSSPVPSPETEALRAARKLRQLKERHEAELKSHRETVDKLLTEANKVGDEMTPAARSILAKLEAEEPEAAQ